MIRNKHDGVGVISHFPQFDKIISKNHKINSCKQVQSELIEELKKSNRWKISSKKYQKQTLTSTLESMKNHSNHVNYIWAHWNQIPNILKVLPSEMKELQILNIGGNNIQSLELLQTINMNKLQQLWLWNNKLVRIDCLRKNQFRSLKYIDISYNMISECPKFYEMNVPKLERINIENNNFSSINFFMKNTNKIKILLVDNKMIKIMKYYCFKGKKVIKRITELNMNLEGNQIPVKYC